LRRDDFLSIASHELKTPLTSLKASLQLLNRIKDKPNSPMHVNLITQSVRSMDKINELIDDLLNVRRLKEGLLQLNKTTFSVKEMLEKSCQHIKLEEKFEILIEADESIAVYADEHRIDQVIVNFVNNAIKYAPRSQQIVLKAEQLTDMVKVSVIDTGPGIPEEKHINLFDRYYRADHSSPNYTGLGLGLYICAETIRRHEGKIGVNSILGEGSRFWFATLS
jgi:two-component system CheB/CheR fusion protein